MNRIADIYRIYRHSFQLRLFVAITGMTILFITATGYFSYLQGKKTIENQIEQYTVGTAEQIAARIRSYLSRPAGNVSLLKASIENGFIDPTDSRDLIRYFHLLQEGHPEFLNINYGDKFGRFTMVPPQRPDVHKLYDPRIRPWYVGAINRKGLYWTGVYVFASSQNPGITASVPILDADRSVMGVCSIDIDLSTFSKFLKTLKIGKKGYAYIIENDQGRVIAHPGLLELHYHPDRIRFLSTGLARLKSSRRQFGITVYQGKKFFTAYSDYPENNWSVGVTLPVSEFLENINAIKKATLSLVLVAVAISLAVSYLMALTVVKPLRTLEKGIKRVSTGDLDYNVNLRDPDIVRSLADAFNQMASSLKRSRREIEKTYAELAEKEKMAALGQLTAGIAHEIKNPLGIMLGSAQVVNNPERPREMRRKAARFIIDEVIRLHKTLKSFLAFARPAPPETAATDLVVLLTETLADLEQTMKQRNVALEKQLPDPGPVCPADPDQMRQVFLNLFINAVQAMPDGGTLTVKAVVETVAESGGGPAETGNGHPSRDAETEARLVISISDTGAGIESGRIEKIFEPFVTFKDDGTGLGLPIVSQILKLHHAGVAVESDVGAGSTFTIYFPMG